MYQDLKPTSNTTSSSVENADYVEPVQLFPLVAQTAGNISQREPALTANLSRQQAGALGRQDFLTTAQAVFLSLLRGRQHGYHRFQSNAEIRLFHRPLQAARKWI